jgi:hypothetical protein
MTRLRNILFPLAVSFTSFPLAADVSLSVRETAGVSRNGELVHNGIPLAREDGITDVNNLSIAGASSAQFEVLSRWGGALNDATKPIQWLLATFPATVQANGIQTYTLTTGSPGSPANALQVVETAADISVRTGPARFVISKAAFSVLKAAYLVDGMGGETSVVDGPSGSSVIRLIDNDTNRNVLQTMTAQAPEEVLREHEGPLFLTIKVSGHYDNAPAGGVALRYVARYTFKAGSPVAELDFYYAWPGSHGGENSKDGIELRSAAADWLLLGSVDLTLPLSLSGPVTGYAGADGGAPLTGALGAGEGASLWQRRRSARTSPASYASQVGSAVSSGGFADRPFVAVLGSAGGAGGSLQKMKFYEPLSMEARADRLTFRVPEPQWLGTYMGAYAKAAIALIPAGGSLDAVRSQTTAGLDRPLVAWPDQSSVSRSRVLGDLWDGTPSLVAQQYKDRLTQVSNNTVSGVASSGLHGLMTYGVMPRAMDELGGGGWDGYLLGARFTDYHSTYGNVVKQFAITGDPNLLQDLSFPGARRTLHTQVLQGNPNNAFEKIGMAPIGYGGYRSDNNGSHQYFQNLFAYYYLTGDRGVIDVLKRSGETIRRNYARRSDGTLVPPDQPPLQNYMQSVDRVASQYANVFWFLGHAWDATFLEDFRNQQDRMITRHLALLQKNGNEYAFLTGETLTDSSTAFTVQNSAEQGWMLALYNLNDLWLLSTEYGDVPMGTSGFPISRLFRAFYNSYRDYASSAVTGSVQPPTGTWANVLLPTWTGNRIGGTIQSVGFKSDMGSDSYLYQADKSLISGFMGRAAALNGEDVGMRALAADLYDAGFSNYPAGGMIWGKISSEQFNLAHAAVAHRVNGSTQTNTALPARPRRLQVR